MYSSPLLSPILSNKNKSFTQQQIPKQQQYQQQQNKLNYSNSTQKLYQPINNTSSQNIIINNSYQQQQQQQYSNQRKSIMTEQQLSNKSESQMTLSNVFLKDLKQQLRLNKKRNEIILTSLIPQQPQQDYLSHTLPTQSQYMMTPINGNFSKTTSVFLIDSKLDTSSSQFLPCMNNQIQNKSLFSITQSDKKFNINNNNKGQQNNSNMSYNPMVNKQQQQQVLKYQQFHKQGTLDKFNMNNSSVCKQNESISYSSDIGQKSPQDFIRKIFQQQNQSIHQEQSGNIAKQSSFQFSIIDNNNNNNNDKYLDISQQLNKDSLFMINNNNIQESLEQRNYNQFNENKLENNNNSVTLMNEKQQQFRKRNISEQIQYENQFSNYNNNNKNNSILYRNDTNPMNFSIYSTQPQFDDQKFKIIQPSSVRNAFKQKNNKLSSNNVAKSPILKPFLSKNYPSSINKKRDGSIENGFSQDKKINQNFVKDYFNSVLQTKDNYNHSKIDIINDSQNIRMSFSNNLNNDIDPNDMTQVSLSGSPSNREVQNILKNLKSNQEKQDENNKKRSQFFSQKKCSTTQYDLITQSIKKKQNLPFGDEINKKKLSMQTNLKKQNTMQTIQSEIINQQLTKFAHIVEDENINNNQVVSPQQQQQNPSSLNIAAAPSLLSSKQLPTTITTATTKLDKKQYKNTMNQNNKIFRQIVSQNQRKKLIPAQVRTAFKKAIYYLRSLDIPICDLLTTTVFSSKPFQKMYAYELIQAAKFGNIMKVRECLNENRYLVYDFDYIYQTALHWATKRNHLQIVDILIKNGADVNCKDIMGRTPLYFAIQLGLQDISFLLLENKASPWSTEEINYAQLAKDSDNIKIISFLNKFKKINIIVSMVPFSKQQQLWEKQVQLLRY